MIRVKPFKYVPRKRSRSRYLMYITFRQRPDSPGGGWTKRFYGSRPYWVFHRERTRQKFAARRKAVGKKFVLQQQYSSFVSELHTRHDIRRYGRGVW